MTRIRILISIIVLTGIHARLDAYNIRHISSRDGLSNSAVICLLQDTERYLWIGTYDGLDKYDGTNISIYKPSVSDTRSLAGNVIRTIVESDADYLWIVTKSGLDKFSKKKGKVVAHFGEFMENCLVTSDHKGNVLVLKQTGTLHYYDPVADRFNEMAFPDAEGYGNCRSLILDSGGRLWVTTRAGAVKRFDVAWPAMAAPRLTAADNGNGQEPVIYTFYDKGRVIVVNKKGDLYVVQGEQKTWIRNIHPELAQYGDITSVIFDDNDVLIAFRVNGLIRLDHKNGYEAEKLPVDCGVFCLLKDDDQDIVWAGTDGQGVYAFMKEEYVFNGISLDELAINKQRPIRAICTDRYNDLWLGTKGNGVIRIKNYSNALEYRSNVEHLTTANGLGNDAVFSFEMSSGNNVLWMGSNGPHLDYYSYDDRRIRHLASPDPSLTFTGVHALLESCDSVLWVAASHNLLKVSVQKRGPQMVVRGLRKFEFDIKNKVRFNRIFSMRQQNDSILWLGMRGNGAIRFNFIAGSYNVLTFSENGIEPMNDILSICIDRNGTKWFGSSYGINRVDETPGGGFACRNFNERDGLPNNTIHGILETHDGRLWLSTNSGITLFDPADTTFRSFNHKTGLKVIEFSDNAYYKDERQPGYFFGGVDGLVWINRGRNTGRHFVPPVYFTKLRVFNEEFPIADFLADKGGENYLRLKHNQNFFTVSFIANDYINGMNGKYSYLLDNFSDVWMDAKSCEARFTNIPPGKYVLRVKYSNGADANDDQIASLNIKISPPWYLTLAARIVYAMAILGALILAYLYLTFRYERKKKVIEQRLDQRFKEEMYEGKLRFLTNITHEFCTPLTLIYTPSERILNYAGSDAFVRKYASAIKSNAEKLNNLIQEIIDFRRMETGNKVCVIESCNINNICTEIVDSFADLAEENRINFTLDIASTIIWNVDPTCITKILNNLISNAFKYTLPNGFIHVTVRTENEHLVLRVYNTGKGIERKDIPYMFNRYSVLDNVETNSIKGLSSRNGLGLAICKSMVDLHGGTIEVESEVDKYAEFIVRLPAANLTETEDGQTTDRQKETAGGHARDNERSAPGKSGTVPDDLRQNRSRPTILIIDDNDTLLSLLRDILSEDYNILVANDGNEGFDKLIHLTPDLVITDVMMPNSDGLSLTKKIKNNPHTMHIPLIILSAKSAIGDKISGIESGADAYISKPFDTQYLKTVIRQLIDRQRNLEEYYNSSISAYDYYNGQLMTRDDRDFIESVIGIIEKNLNNIEFSPEDLADNLRVSMRTLYRRFKELDLLPPKDFIKEQRITQAAKMILKTNYTIQEVMYSVGFTTRSHFYKEFTKRYSQSPKEYRESHSDDAIK